MRTPQKDWQTMICPKAGCSSTIKGSPEDVFYCMEHNYRSGRFVQMKAIGASNAAVRTRVRDIVAKRQLAT